MAKRTIPIEEFLSSTSAWTTLLPRDGTVHAAWFIPEEWPQFGPIVKLQVPEGIVAIADPNDEGGIALTPLSDRNEPLRTLRTKVIEKWLTYACNEAQERKAAFAITAPLEAESKFKMVVAGVKAYLPTHKRIPLERLFGGCGTGDGELN